MVDSARKVVKMADVILIKNKFLEKLEQVIQDKLGNNSSKIVLKAHFGEYGNLFHVRPQVIGKIVEVVKAEFVFDTLPVYVGSRDTVSKYLDTARRNGFTQETISCPIKIFERKDMERIETEHLVVEVPVMLSEYTLVVVSHGKGHWHSAGYGGAIKNLGMGCVSANTKKDIHEKAGPILIGNCVRCGACVKKCPFDALTLKNSANPLIINMKSCVGCGRCINACPQKVLKHRVKSFGYLLSEAAKAVKDMVLDMLFITQLMNITRSCDCIPDPGFPECKDIGFLISSDPVAIDSAAIDLIERENPEFFKDMSDPRSQTIAGEKLGLGSTNYNLIRK